MHKHPQFTQTLEIPAAVVFSCRNCGTEHVSIAGLAPKCCSQCGCAKFSAEAGRTRTF